LINGVVGKVASPAPAIRITDSKTHKPLANITVEFRPINGGPVENFRTVTDATGLASPGAWTLGAQVGPNYLMVYINGVRALTFTAMTKPDIPARLFANPAVQAALPGSSLDGAVVYVRDKFLNPVPNVTVTFAISDPLTQSLGLSSSISDATGRAVSGEWKLGPTPGATQITASVPGLESAVFKAQILDPASIKWYSLDSIQVDSRDYTPISKGISEARIGITAFDPCLCKRQEGFFIDEFVYSQQLMHSSGRYSLDGPALMTPFSNNAGTVEQGKLLLPRPDPDFGSDMTWIYKEI
jgi:hypothetical protein